jgi:ribosomal protein S18 acetylase RimI-like enzyme
VQLRRATPGDRDAIARLHADSWRASYRGIYTDEYLDHAAADERLAVWRERFASWDPQWICIVGELDGEVSGFAHTVPDDDPQWGALLDNLHVAPTIKRRGHGRALMRATARALLDEHAGSMLHLWVLEENAGARAFYERVGGAVEERAAFEAPGGGSVMSLRIVWRDPSVLVSR